MRQFDQIPGLLALYCTATLGIILSGVFMYDYLRQKTAETAALLGALLYMTALYHLGTDLYYRFAFSEIWAFAFMPLCLYYLEKPSPTGLTLAYAALILTHLLTAIIFTPILVVMILMQKKFTPFISLAIGFGLAALYWLPAISNLDIVSPQVGVGIYSINKNFLSLNTPEGIYLSLTAALLLLYMPFKTRERENHIWIAILIGSIFMALPFSALIWKLIPQLSVLSFPWRFLALAVLAASILSIHAKPKYVIVLIILNIALAYPAIIGKNTQNAEPYLKANMITTDDFRTKWTDQELINKNGFKTPAKLKKLETDADAYFHPREMTIHSTHAGLVTIPQFYYPNWKSEYPLNPSPKTGLMQINLPQPGTYIINFVYSQEEKDGFLISGISLLLLIARFAFIRSRYGN